jgi:hypothetical protein
MGGSMVAARFFEMRKIVLEIIWNRLKMTRAIEDLHYIAGTVSYLQCRTPKHPLSKSGCLDACAEGLGKDGQK